MTEIITIHDPFVVVSPDTTTITISAGGAQGAPGADGTAAVVAHIAASDPHTQYQLEVEKGAIGGYAALDGSALVPLAQVPTLDDAHHGNRAGGSLHANATQMLAGFMSSIDKIKLDNTPAGQSLIFRAGGVPGAGVVTDWAGVAAFSAGQSTPWDLYIDSSLAACEVPAGTSVDFRNFATLHGVDFSTLTILDTGEIKNPRSITDQLFVSIEALTVPGLIFDNDTKFFLSNLAVIESSASSTVAAVSHTGQYAIWEISEAAYVSALGFATFIDFPTASGDHYFLFKNYFQPGFFSPIPDNTIAAVASSVVSCIHDGTARLGAQSGVTTLANYAVERAQNIIYTPLTPGNWTGSPTTIQDAIDRIADVVSASGATPIP